MSKVRDILDSYELNWGSSREETTADHRLH